MNILVDANILTRKQKTGVDYYALGLIDAAAKRMPSDKFVLVHFGWRAYGAPTGNNIRIKKIWWLPAKMYGLYRHFLHFLPFDLFVPIKADIMLFPDFGCSPTIQRVPKLTIIHDLVYKLQPEYVPEQHREFLDMTVKNALRLSTEVIVNSISTKHDLLRVYPESNKSINILPPAVDQTMYQPAGDKAVKAVRSKYNLPPGYILFLGTIEPRKNLANIIRAYNKLPATLQKQYKLVLAGKKGWLDDEIDELCRQAGDFVVRTGRIEATDKAALYSGASAFIFPSLYEGFGIPVLEAMACGTPVLTSNVSSLPEVAGKAAELVDPSNVSAIAKGLEKLLTDKKLAQKYVKLGHEQANKFTWEKSGEQLATLLRRLVKS